MFRSISRAIRELTGTLQEILEVLTTVTEALNEVLAVWAAHRPLGDRMDDLETGRLQWEADVEGLLLKAGGQLHAARASEERARGMERRARALGSDEGGEEPIEDLREQLALPDAPASPGEEMQPLHPFVEGISPREAGKELAKARKFARG
jgi:hypothetical protein